MSRFALWVIAIMLGAGATSCFTGIESTPRISTDDLRRSGVKATPEQAFAALLEGESPAEWTAGKQWLVSEDKISIIFSGSPAGADSLAGSILRLEGISEAKTLTGADVVELRLLTPDNNLLVYRTDVPADEWKSRKSFNIPFTVELDPVMCADSLLRGKELYITTPLWYDENGHRINGLRHIPVTVSSVKAGTANYPLKVCFTAAEDDAPVRCVYMTYGNSPSSNRNFDKLFRFDNPRLGYPDISDRTWGLIIRSQLAEGMSRDEARLALGSPASIDRGATRGSMQIERWSYDNGVFLIFEEGVLIRYRK